MLMVVVAVMVVIAGVTIVIMALVLTVALFSGKFTRSQESLHQEERDAEEQVGRGERVPGFACDQRARRKGTPRDLR